MAWLMRLVMKLESMPAVRRQLMLVANPAAFMRAGRIFLAERVAKGEASVPPSVSIRATGVVCRALHAARDPIPYATLAASLLANTPGATVQKVEKLLTELWEQTLLLTDLRPPLTVESPGRYVVDRLAGIYAAAEVRAGIQSTLEAAAAWDASPQEQGAERYRAMVAEAAKFARFDRSPFQVDAGLELTGQTVSRRVGEEVARAAELLLRISPLPRGSAHISAYRRAFEQRYGAHREVPILELLDPNFGLGPPLSYGNNRFAVGINQTPSLQRTRTLMALALAALRERTLRVDLDEQTLERLETREPSASVPQSLDLFVSVAAVSREALDAGEFQVVLGPNIGSQAAGRTLGRFTDLVDGARDALQRAAESEERHAPEKLWAELVYQPRLLRLANVSIRPNPRKYEIALGVGSGGGAARTIPLDELVVGIRDDRFYIRWPAAGRDVAITSGHMLNYLRAPAVCRFLAEASRDGCCYLAGFNWGSASNFPFLPRIQVGRLVLALAQWRLAANSAGEMSAEHPDDFQPALERWRAHWQVPRHVYFSSGDNRLLLDLSARPQADELRRAILRLRGDDCVVLSEVLPDLDHAWVRDGDHRPFVTELAVPLALRSNKSEAATPAGKFGPGEPGRDGAAMGTRELKIASSATRVRPPGSEWLFVKLYGARGFEDDLIAGPIRSLVGQALASGMAKGWFFLRYGDPERHLRLRFRGEPERLLQELLPAICTWAADLIEEGLCSRFVFDTYEREIERFGGCAGMTTAEAVFAADSQAVVDLIHLLQAKNVVLDRVTLAVLTVDALLEGLGLDPRARFEWCKRQVRARKETSGEYRQRKDLLRALLGDGDRLRREAGGPAVAEILADLRNSAAELNKRYVELASSNELDRPPSDLYQSFAHLHLNRLLGADSLVERRVLGLLWRAREGLHRAPLADAQDPEQ